VVVVSEIEDKDYGTALPAERNAEEHATDYLASRKWGLGMNKANGYIIFIGTGAINKVDPESFMEQRATAYESALLDAREQMAAFLAKQISAEVERLVRIGERRGATSSGEAPAIDQPPTQGTLGALDKVKAILNHELDVQLRQRGIDPSSKSPEELARAEQAAATISRELIGSESFQRAIRSEARHEVSGLNSFRTYESTKPDYSGQVAVIAIYSPSSAALQRALLGRGEPPMMKPAEQSVAQWARDEGPGMLVYGHGAQLRCDESGEVVIVGLGQAMPRGKQAFLSEAAKKEAIQEAEAAIRMFMGAMIVSSTISEKHSTLKAYSDDSSEFTFDKKFDDETKAVAKSLNMPGMQPVFTWSYRHPKAPRESRGAVVAYSRSSMIAANDLRAKISASSAAEGGAGGSTLRSKQPAAPAAPTPTGKTSKGVGPAGVDP
jgi:hypothetical protein